MKNIITNGKLPSERILNIYRKARHLSLSSVWRSLRSQRGAGRTALQLSWQNHSWVSFCEKRSHPQLLLSKLPKRQNDLRAEEADSADVVISQQKSNRNAQKGALPLSPYSENKTLQKRSQIFQNILIRPLLCVVWISSGWIKQISYERKVHRLAFFWHWNGKTIPRVCRKLQIAHS